ncbi:MAG: cytochrome P450 [Gordonia sp. (in: high G+C Gram-positive bacteria)]|nr:MAG: cytochrome P450 [Gordonia sp. (in: high G+C Gram-positive bacteria)]
MHDLNNPYPFYAELRRSCPVHRVGDSSFYVVSTWDLIAEALARPQDFSSNLTATMLWRDDHTVGEVDIASFGAPLHVLATADGDRHRGHRTMVMPSLVAGRVRALEAFVRDTYHQLWRAGLDEHNRIDWVQAVAQRLPMTVIAHLVGLPACDIDDLLRWTLASTVLLDAVVTTEEVRDAVAAVVEFSTYLAEAFDAAVTAPGTDVVSDLARAAAGGDIDRETAIHMLIQIVTAGAESTVSLLGTSVWMLGRRPDTVEQLRTDHTLVPVFIEEALRLESPFRGHYRHVVNDTTLGDVHLPAGSHLYLAWGSANRDPERFDNPDTLDLRPPRRRTHMAFGKGLHLCVGAALARLQGRIGVEFLLESTTALKLDNPAPDWTPSVLSRRLRTLPMTVRPS